MGLNSLLTFCSCPGVTRADKKRRRNNEIIAAGDVSIVAEFQWGCFFALSICFLANRNWICGDSCEKPRSTRGLPRLVFAVDSGGNINVFFSQGRSQEFVPKGTKEWVPSPLTSGIHTRTKPRLGSEAKPQKPENMLKFWLNVTNSILVGEKKFSPWQFRRGTCPPCPPLPYAPVFWHPDWDVTSKLTKPTDAKGIESAAATACESAMAASLVRGDAMPFRARMLRVGGCRPIVTSLCH